MVHHEPEAVKLSEFTIAIGYAQHFSKTAEVEHIEYFGEVKRMFVGDVVRLADNIRTTGHRTRTANRTSSKCGMH